MGKDTVLAEELEILLVKLTRRAHDLKVRVGGVLERLAWLDAQLGSTSGTFAQRLDALLAAESSPRGRGSPRGR